MEYTLVVGLFLFPVLAPLTSLGVPEISQVLITQEVSHSATNGTMLEYYGVGEQMIISTVLMSHFDESLSAIAIIEVRDSKDITTYLSWSSVELQPFTNTTVGLSWIPDAADDYQIRTFAIDDFQEPQVLSPLATARIEVVDTVRTPITFFDHAPNTTLNPSNYTLTEAQDLSRQVARNIENCYLYGYNENDDSARYSYLLPKSVSFEYLQMSYPTVNLMCTYGGRGVTVSEVNGTFVPTESLVKIESAEQALEYLHYFRLGNSMLYTEQDYLNGFDDATLVEHSPIRRLHVIDNGNSFTVKVNVLNVDNSDMTYQRWNIKPDAGTDGFREYFPEYSTLVAKLHYAA